MIRSCMLPLLPRALILAVLIAILFAFSMPLHAEPSLCPPCLRTTW